jgi:hypothetical protein
MDVVLKLPASMIYRIKGIQKYVWRGDDELLLLQLDEYEPTESVLTVIFLHKAIHKATMRDQHRLLNQL